MYRGGGGSSKGRGRAETSRQGPGSDALWWVETPEHGACSEVRDAQTIVRLGALLEPWPGVVSRSAPLRLCTFVTSGVGDRGHVVCESPQTVDYGSIHVTVEGLLDLLVGDTDTPSTPSTPSTTSTPASCASCGGAGWGHVRWFVGGGVAVRVYVTSMERVGWVGEEFGTTRRVSGRHAGVGERLDPRLEVRQVLSALRRLAMDVGGTNHETRGRMLTNSSRETSMCVGTVRWCVARRRAVSGVRFEVGGDSGLMTRMMFDPLSEARVNASVRTIAGMGVGVEEGWMGRWVRGLVGADVDTAAVVREAQEGGYAAWDRLHWEYAGRVVAGEEIRGGDGDGREEKTRAICRDSDFLWDGAGWRFLYGDDLYSAIIAAFLSSSIYQTFCRDHCGDLESSSGQGTSDRSKSSPGPQEPTCEVAVTGDANDARDANDTVASSSVKIVIDDLIFESHAEVQFHGMRERYIQGGHAAFVLSLMNCRPWSLPSSGGKSNAYFSKSHCGRYVVKQISRTEFESFLEFAGAYFGFMGEHGASSLMAKVFGVFTITVAPSWATGTKIAPGGMGSKTGKNVSQSRAHRERKEMHFVVTENVLGCVVGGNESQGASDMTVDVHGNGGLVPVIYDLKGVCGRRAKPTTSRDADERPGQMVYLDGDMVDLVEAEPLLIRGRELEDFQTRLERDTAFLASINVMDYSLLCTLLYSGDTRHGNCQDTECSEHPYHLGRTGRGRPHAMRVGIIDYLRDFTVEKRLESHLKRGLVGEEMTTVVEPARYASRFVDSILGYLGSPVPDAEN